jgi:hypothetical protein
MAIWLMLAPTMGFRVLQFAGDPTASPNGFQKVPITFMMRLPFSRLSGPWKSLPEPFAKLLGISKLSTFRPFRRHREASRAFSSLP